MAWHLELLAREQNLEVCGLVPDGDGAIEQAIDLDVDLILMDIRLAGRMDGIEAARRIREQRDTPIIFITAHGDPATRAHDRAGAAGHAGAGQADHRRRACERGDLARRPADDKSADGRQAVHVTAVGASASMSVTTSMIDRAVGGERLRQRRRQALRILDADAERAHLLGDAGEVDLAEGPQLARLLGLGAAIDAVEAALDWLPPPLLLTTVTALIFQRTAVSISPMWYQKPASPVNVTTGRSGAPHLAPSPAGNAQPRWPALRM